MKNCLELASHIKGRMSKTGHWGYAVDYTEGFLDALVMEGKITDYQAGKIIRYVTPESYFVNYTEIDREIPKIKEFLKRTKLKK